MRISEKGAAQMPYKVPSGPDLLAKLVELLADQEGVNITYEIKAGDELCADT